MFLLGHQSHLVGFLDRFGMHTEGRTCIPWLRKTSASGNDAKSLTIG